MTFPRRAGRVRSPVSNGSLKDLQRELCQLQAFRDNLEQNRVESTEEAQEAHWHASVMAEVDHRILGATKLLAGSPPRIT